jgi:hypothetical protein
VASSGIVYFPIKGDVVFLTQKRVKVMPAIQNPQLSIQDIDGEARCWERNALPTSTIVDSIANVRII